MQNTTGNKILWKQPDAWIPIAISLAALAFIAVYAAVYGTAQNPGGDERAPARIFQFLMAAQIPLIAFFALRWLPKRPKQALLILALQAAAWIIPVVTIILIESR